jgi:hypothetical protein
VKVYGKVFVTLKKLILKILLNKNFQRFSCAVGFAQLFAVLYFCIPTIPIKIKNETNGTRYSFGNLKFDLAYNKYVEYEDINALMESRGMDPSQIIILQDEDGSADFMIMKAIDGNEKVLSESFINFKNPFLHKSATAYLKDYVSQNSTYLYSNNLSVKNINKKLYSGTNKECILSTITLSNEEKIYTLDIKLGDSFFTVLPRAHDEDALSNLLVFMKTVNIN